MRLRDLSKPESHLNQEAPQILLDTSSLCVQLCVCIWGILHYKLRAVSCCHCSRPSGEMCLYVNLSVSTYLHTYTVNVVPQHLSCIEYRCMFLHGERLQAVVFFFFRWWCLRRSAWTVMCWLCPITCLYTITLNMDAELAGWTPPRALRHTWNTVSARLFVYLFRRVQLSETMTKWKLWPEPCVL